jgi:hypothetical protein
MKQKGAWKARVIMLSVVAVMGAAFMTMLNAAGDPVAVTGSGEVAACTASQSSEADAWTADFEAPGTSSQQAGEVAICRLLPECWSNSDCDFKCGVGLGKCIHSKCPVRVCRC